MQASHIRIAFALWLVWILLGAARGRANIEAILAFLTLFGAFELVSLYTGTLPNQVLRTLHVGFLCLTACGLLANADETSPPARIFWWAVGIVGFTLGLYHWWNYNELVNRAGELTHADMVVGVSALIVLFLLVWRAMGIALPLVAGTFLASLRRLARPAGYAEHM